MNHTKPLACITFELLRFIRDTRPTPNALVKWLGPSEAGRFYVLKEAGFLTVQDGVVRLSPDHSTEDETRFSCGNKLYFIDEGRMNVYRRKRNADGTFDELLPRREDSAEQIDPEAKRGWKAIVGKFADDPLYDEAMRHGREWREKQFDEDGCP